MKPVFHKNINSIDQFSMVRILLWATIFLLLPLKTLAQSATISGDATVCQGAAEPLVTFTGADGIPEYTFTYTINGGEPLAVSTTGGASIVTLPAPTSSAGTFVYTLVDVTDGSSTTNTATGSVTIVVNALPAEITGTFNVCAGSTVTLSSATTGGTWSSGTPAVATINAESGVVTGVLAGSSVITYTLGTGCFVTQTVTVNPLPTTSAIYHQ